TISEEEELKRVIPPITSIRKNFPEIVISIDTWRSRVATEAVNAGATMVNDISAGTFDEELWKTVASLHVPYILMHMQNTPTNMQEQPCYENVVKEVFDFLKEKIFQLNA